jgi:hypothetical protein
MPMFLATVLVAAAVAAPVTAPATDVGATGATLHGTVDAPAMNVHFEYGTTASGGYGLATPAQQVTAAGDVSATVSGLTGETEYHYRIVADGVVGNEQKFTTTANPLPPVISNQRTRDVTIDSATATASVDANGTPTTYIVEWGTTSQYGSQTAPASAGSGSSPTTVTAKITDLKPYTLYHWRTVATNAAGTVRGRDRTFRSARQPSGVTIGLSRRTVPYGGDFRLGGRVTGVGVGGLTVALQQQRFPLDQDFTQLATARTGSDGGYLFTIPALYTTTRYRVVTQTQVAVTSPVATARSAVRVGARARHVSRRRATVSGTVVPGVHGTASLQRYRRGVGWRQVKAKTVAPADELRTRYRFIVRRPRKRAAPYRLRVVMLPVKGAHVRGKSRTVFVRPRS